VNYAKDFINKCNEDRTFRALLEQKKASVNIESQTISFAAMDGLRLEPFEVDLDSDGQLYAIYDKERFVFFLDGLIDFGNHRRIDKTVELFVDLVSVLFNSDKSNSLWKSTLWGISRLYIKSKERTYSSAPSNSSRSNIALGYLLPMHLGKKERIV
jgi:hypothetical protein